MFFLGGIDAHGAEYMKYLEEYFYSTPLLDVFTWTSRIVVSFRYFPVRTSRVSPSVLCHKLFSYSKRTEIIMLTDTRTFIRQV
jgi:hypothetical protein